MKKLIICTVVVVALLLNFLIDTYKMYKEADLQDTRVCYIDNPGEIGMLKCSIAYLLKSNDFLVNNLQSE